MLEKVKRTIWKKWKGNFQKKKPEKIVFFGWLWGKCFFCKMSFFRKIGKHYLCSDGKKQTRIFVATICFWKMVLFCGHSKWQNTIKIGVSAGTGENPKWHFWLQKCHFGKGPRKGFYYLWFLKAMFCWKHYFYSVFSKTQLCRHERAKKKTKIGVVCQWTKVCLLVLFWVLVVLFFGFSVFLYFCFVHNSPKWLFSCIFRGFLSILFPQKACLKLFIFFLFCFFAFVFPFKNPFSSLRFCPWTPF